MQLRAGLTRRILCGSRKGSTPVTAHCTVFSLDPIDIRPGQITLEVSGKNAQRLFSHEPGGHRFQRVPPNEKRGRRHTSTVTVAVLPVPAANTFVLDERDVEWQATVGSGNGGQNRNKLATCVQMRHKPTGVAVRVETERSQKQNRDTALRLLSAKLAERQQQTAQRRRADERREQVGTGMRGDKIRTVRMQDGSVVDHNTGKRTTTARYLKGNVDDLF